MAAGKGDERKPVAESPGEKVAVGISIAAVGGMFSTALVKPLAEAATAQLGLALATLVWVAGCVFTLALVVMFWRYVAAIKGAVEKPGTAPRQDYQALRDSIADGGKFGAGYARALTLLLDAVDRFFGDAGQPAPGWQWRLFMRDDRAPRVPLWSAPAYDRCLLLALLYPILVLVLGWMVSGHVGVAERALDFKIGVPGWRRGLVGVALLTSAAAAFTSFRGTGWRYAVWDLVCFGAFAGAFAVAVAVAVTSAVAVPVAFAVVCAYGCVFAVRVVVAGAVAVAGVVAGAFALAGAFAVAGVGAFAVTVAFAIAVDFAVARSKSHGWQSGFNTGFSLLLLVICLATPLALASLKGWSMAGPLLLFFGLLTVVNAPFDWLSLGLTRGLLRMGLAKGGAWPWVLALLDAVLASLLVVLLSAAMVLTVQAFDALAGFAGGKAVLPLKKLLDGMRAWPTEPEFWWLYALLLSTLLPSAVNAVIGCASWLRSWPRVNAWLLQRMPERKGTMADALVYRRLSVAGVLTAQLAVGTLLGVAALGLWIWGLLGWLMPLLGLNLLDAMRWLVGLNLPQHLLAAGAG